MRKTVVLLTALFISIPAMAQDRPQQVSDEIIQQVQKEYAPIYCEPNGLEKAAKAVELCYMKTNREDPKIEKCIWADLMVGSTYNTLEITSNERGLPGAFTPIPFLEIPIRNKRNAYYMYTSKHFEYLHTIEAKQQYFLSRSQPALDNFIQSCKQ